MEIILILFICLIAFLIFILIWVFRNPIRRKIAIIGICSMCLIGMMYYIFFIDHSMQFIQSKVYPSLYLVKNEVQNRDYLNKLIKKMVIQKLKTEFIGKENTFKSKYQYSADSTPRTELNYSIAFYSYFEGWGTNPFGEAGTAHFIEHEEDPGGFSSELLEHYSSYQIAEFNVQFCPNDTNNYIGVLNYYLQDELIKTDTILNSCNKTVH